VWDDAGHVVTNFHVVQDARSLTVTFQNQQTFEAQVVGVEPRKDIAVLAVAVPKTLLKPVKVTKHVDLEVGQKTIAIGNPFGLDHTLTTGVVSAIGRQVQASVGGDPRHDSDRRRDQPRQFRRTAPRLFGRVIGMNTIIYSKSGSSAGIGFAVAMSTIQRSFRRSSRTARPSSSGSGWRSIPQRKIERRFGIRGVVVLDVVAGTPAAKAGLRGISQTFGGLSLGDIVVGIDDQKVDDFDDLYNALDHHHAGETVAVKVRRGNDVATVKIEVIALPSKVIALP